MLAVRLLHKSEVKFVRSLERLSCPALVNPWSGYRFCSTYGQQLGNYPLGSPGFPMDTLSLSYFSYQILIYFKCWLREFKDHK